ncbi:tryptophan synthase subunit alpha [Boudabousia liubingyangii]|uniref:tryptophan synthase subunit alpha n=1 Tax=Boudabousia liubingyangii TaxID=1921764 RepID=UPI0009393CB2|nr:tryptophan synthase subunit alpha [Boudabousia liubingyangii]OKL46831.1 tryptophan synthase subunit alpha [Boudabousia liubingyangii]
MTHYQPLFERLNRAESSADHQTEGHAQNQEQAQTSEGALVPFVMIGDPTPEASVQVIDALIAGGADALELGFPFSDPVADGPTIQDAHLRALAAGTDAETCWDVLSQVRAKHPQVPIGLLVYANLPFSMGLEAFYQRCAEVGVDSVLIPDVPTRESAQFVAAAQAAGVDPVFIAPPHAREDTLAAVGAASRGYVYAVSRVGVTGVEREASTDGLSEVVRTLRAYTDLPVLLGFGISRPEHVRAALAAGADGAITGSATVKLIAQHCADLPDGQAPADLTPMLSELTNFVQEMKAATK